MYRIEMYDEIEQRWVVADTMLYPTRQHVDDAIKILRQLGSGWDVAEYRAVRRRP
jgi:hypothetical protein